MAKFKVGDTVKVGGEKGTITEVPELAPEFLAKNEQFYSVALEAWPAEVKDGKPTGRYQHPQTGKLRDHARDSLGCVPESEIS